MGVSMPCGEAWRVEEPAVCFFAHLKKNTGWLQVRFAIPDPRAFTLDS
jgi:hypothetical protein